MSKELLLDAVKQCLIEVGVSLDLTRLQLYYDGLSEEEFTRSGTAVYRCPVWYGGLDSDPESFTLSVYEIEENRVCISLRRFFDNRPYTDTDLFVKTSA